MCRTSLSLQLAGEPCSGGGGVAFSDCASWVCGQRDRRNLDGVSWASTQHRGRSRCCTTTSGLRHQVMYGMALALHMQINRLWNSRRITVIRPAPKQDEPFCRSLVRSRTGHETCRTCLVQLVRWSFPSSTQQNQRKGWKTPSVVALITARPPLSTAIFIVGQVPTYLQGRELHASSRNVHTSGRYFPPGTAPLTQLRSLTL